MDKIGQHRHWQNCRIHDLSVIYFLIKEIIILKRSHFRQNVFLPQKLNLEMRGIDPRTSRMLSERSTI
ncbi:hypothetical protein EUTSA_v10005245mg [Eutrema salsugineum]|uniref:Uncharacterized protein n=1 Tax=Eutrema salsugineum TaxID=72664 RepID=V4KST2_EUTSA|nr:hypothetical protein EUTSA_v10005245mg [Eutrema salsugineum]